jgi:hypothetical protein
MVYFIHGGKVREVTNISTDICKFVLLSKAVDVLGATTTFIIETVNMVTVVE